MIIQEFKFSNKIGWGQATKPNTDQHKNIPNKTFFYIFFGHCDNAEHQVPNTIGVEYLVQNHEYSDNSRTNKYWQRIQPNIILVLVIYFQHTHTHTQSTNDQTEQE